MLFILLFSKCIHFSCVCQFCHRSPKENLYLLQIHFTLSRVVEVNLYFIVMFVVFYFNLCYSVIYIALLVVA